jgi:serine/threonine protein kinase
MPLSSGYKPGDRLGPYEIVSAIGEGGMGEVWRARDPQLGRDVAIKISVQQFTDRVEREARAIAALNHPNVCTLYHIGPNYLVMEYIEGSTLAERTQEVRFHSKKLSLSRSRSAVFLEDFFDEPRRRVRQNVLERHVVFVHRAGTDSAREPENFPQIARRIA